MKTLLLGKSVLTLTLGLLFTAPEALNALQGRWVLTEEARAAFPPECAQAAYVFSSDTITMESGQLRVETAYTADHLDGVLHIRQSDLRHNGQPNCQGRSAAFVEERFLMDLELELVEDQLRFYWPRKSDGKYFSLQRAESAR